MTHTLLSHRITPFHLNHYDSLLDAIGDARFVLIGEASHGTREFYEERAVITKRLVQEKGFTAVFAEADYPDASTVNKYIQIYPNRLRTADALGDFKRFPLWMWRNQVMVPFIEWCRNHNRKLKEQDRGFHERVSFHGLDFFSLQSSSHAVIDYLAKVDPRAAELARDRCFMDIAQRDEQSFGCCNFNLINTKQRHPGTAASSASTTTPQPTPSRRGMASTSGAKITSSRKRSEYLLASLDCFDMPDSEPSDADLDSERPHATERDRLKVELAFTAEVSPGNRANGTGVYHF
ncbi:hypothetical protein BC938DRAFT_478036 [Jimgerdemannia flammicorona]|uniref:Erythromycin esterase n=1 Tax=Jimgerdemannia flammicorona TaxID=994334 RepID=A0A433QNH1_9FUNG|nr:hypothetical protein BC938DRAFT_478036 [Jimgerdemannia flammicorona]